MRCGAEQGRIKGWRRHNAAGESPCGPCEKAHRDHERKRTGGAVSGQRTEDETLRRRAEAREQMLTYIKGDG